MVNTMVAFVKVNALIDLLKEDPELLEHAKVDVLAAFAKVGVELTVQECEAVDDVLKESNTSSLSLPLASYEDWVANHRRQLCL